jgi:hypothetical protein
MDLNKSGRYKMAKMEIQRKEGGMPVSEAVDLASLVEYGEGAVVSRTLIQATVGTVTVFAFDKGQGLSEHSTPFDALVQVLDGSAEITIGGEKERRFPYPLVSRFLCRPTSPMHCTRLSGTRCSLR